ncbi:hypothetical protein [Lacrimispora indolis]|uniref:hypothetical protein n=1 Tax=Lacrimispora indolis TaxID=69825 RepID=UPI0003F6FF35|nr:hypothetical protein [[Clostridium] methoxybenzovorans]
MIKITESAEKLTPAKKNIQVKDVYVKDLKFVDETGDITQQVIDAMPNGVDKVSFKITIELLEEPDEIDVTDDEE